MPKRAGEILDGGRARNAPRASCIAQYRDLLRGWNQFAQQLKTLAVELFATQHNPGYIAAGVRQAVGKSFLNKILPADHDDRYRARQSMYRLRVARAGCDDDIGFCSDQLGGVGFARRRVFAGDTALDAEIASLDPAEVPHGLVEMTARPRLAGDDKTDARAL